MYSGAIGYFSLNGATDLAVAIRTLVLTRAARRRHRGLSLGVGGAITADSSPQEEYEEIRTKAFGVLSALGAEFPRADAGVASAPAPATAGWPSAGRRCPRI